MTQWLIEPDQLIFVTPGGTPCETACSTGAPSCRRNAALPPEKHGLRFYDLRHTDASLSLAVSPNLHVVKERLGHNNVRTTIDT